MTKTDLKELKREFEEFSSQTIISKTEGYLVIPKVDIWEFMEQAVSESLNKGYKIGLIEGHLDARRRVVEEIELELEAWFDVHFEKNRGFKSDDLFKHLQKLKEK